MRGRIFKTMLSAGSAAVLFTSTAASANSAPTPVAQAATPSGWLALSMLNTSGTVGLGDAAAQPGPPPEAQPSGDPYEAGGIPTLVIAFWVLTVAAMVYI